MANMVKTPDELMKILKAATMGDMCFTHILQFIEPGMTEKMVADEIEKTLLSLWRGRTVLPDDLCVRRQHDSAPRRT